MNTDLYSSELELRIHKLECALREIEIWAKNPELFENSEEALGRISYHAAHSIDNQRGNHDIRKHPKK